MPVLHSVLFKWKPGTSDDAIAKQLAVLDGLEIIPGVEWLETGLNLSDRGQGFTHSVVARYRDHETIAVFRDHPLHLAALPGLRAILEEAVIFDMPLKH